MLVKPANLNAALVFFLFFLTLFVDRAGVYNVYFYVASLLFLCFLIKRGGLLFEGKPFPVSLLALVFLIVYLVLANIAVLGFNSSFRAIGNSVETVFFVFMAYSASLVFLNNRALFSNLFFALVFFGFASIVYPYLIGGYDFQRAVGSGFLSKAVLGPSVLLVYWVLGCFLFFSVEAKPKDTFAFSVATVCVLVYTLLSQSRGPIIAVVVSICFILLLSAFSSHKKRLVSSLSVFLLSVVSVSYVFLNFVSLSSLFKRGSSYRLEIWAAVIENSGGSFWLGNGVMGEFNEGAANKVLLESIGFDMHHAHNTLIQLFYDGGFIGLVVFIVAMTIMAYELVFKNKAKVEKYWVGIIVLGMVMINFTDTSKFISSPKEAWVMLWLPLVFVAALLSRDTLEE